MRLLVVVLVLCGFASMGQNGDVADFSSLSILNEDSHGEMMDFTVSANQRYIAIANENGTIKLFDGFHGKFLRSIQGPHKEVLEIALSNDGKRLISLDKSNKLAIINTKSGEVIKQISFKGNLRGFDMNKQGTMAAVGDKNGNLTLFDTENLDVIYEKKLGSTQVSSVGFSDDGKLLAVGTGIAYGYMIKDQPIFIVNAKDGEVLGKLKGAPGATTSMTFNRSGSQLYTGHKNNTKQINIWNLSTYSFVKQTAKTTNWMSNTGYNSIYVNSDESILFATTDDKAIEIFDLKTDQIISKKGRGKVNLMRGLQYFNKKIYPLGEGNNFLIGGFNQNLLYIFSSAKKGVVGYLHPYEEEWAVVGADGRMDGSLGAIQNLAWRSGLSQIPLEYTFELNFSPKLFSELTKTNEVVEEFSVETFAEEIPKIRIASVDEKSLNSNRGSAEYSSSQKNVKLKLEVLENMSSLQEVQLFHNGKLVASSKEIKETYEFELSLTDAFGTDNFVYCLATNTKGISSEKSKLLIKYTGKSDVEPALHLVTIGINKYRNPKYNLNYALSDADSLQKYFQKGAKGIFSKVNLYELRDSQALKSSIIEVFEKLKSTSYEQDLVIFYYAGHGVMSDSEDKDFYIVPHDVIQMYGRDDVLKEKGLSATELKDISRDINAQKQVFILDACQSAGALDAFSARGAAEERAIAQLARSTGTYWITATGSDQFATEFEQLGHGVFTYSLIEGLKGMADNGDSRITVKELSAYVESRVPELSEKYKGTPQFPSGFSFGNDFPLIIINR